MQKLRKKAKAGYFIFKCLAMLIASGMVFPCAFSVVFAQDTDIPVGMEPAGNTNRTYYQDYIYKDSSLQVVYVPADAYAETYWTSGNTAIVPVPDENGTAVPVFTDGEEGTAAVVAASAADPALSVQFNVSIENNAPPAGTFTAECSLYPASGNVSDGIHDDSYRIAFDDPIGHDVTSMALETGKYYYLEAVFQSETCVPSMKELKNAIDETGLLRTAEWIGPEGVWDEENGTLTVGQIFAADRTGTGIIYLGNEKMIYVTVEESSGSWKRNDSGWWYDNGDGTCPHGDFKEINGFSYYFGLDGYPVTGWQNIDDDWYYFSASGIMATSGWEDNCWLGEDGRMAVSAWVDNGRYYVDANGKLSPPKWQKSSRGWWYDYGNGTYPVSRFETIGSARYYFDENGYMLTGWQQINDNWFYFDSFGAASRGWQQIGEDLYYFNEANQMVKGLAEIDGGIYYFDAYGKMVTGWVNLEDDWYFFKDSGAMAVSEWEDVYYLKEDGTMAVSEWVEDRQHYTGWDGALVEPYGEPHWAQSKKGWRYDTDGYGLYMTDQWAYFNDELYYFDSLGYIVSGWYYEDGFWYYLSDRGAYRNEWVQEEGKWYYLREDCTMVTGKFTIEGRTYRFSSSGAWITSEIEAYIREAFTIADDNSHGYSMEDRWGPDYDCSSFVITCLRNTGFNTGSATYTGNLKNLTDHGWVWYTDISKRQIGDILLNVDDVECGHTAIYLGDYRGKGYEEIIDAAGGGNGETGDQSTEIDARPARIDTYDWDGFLRYEGN